MSALLRLPFALLTALAMVLLWSGVASAEGGTEGASPPACPLGVPLPGCETQEPAPQAPAAEPTGTGDQAQDGLTGPSDAEPAYTGPQELPAQEPVGTSSTEETGGQQTGEQESGEQTPAPSSDSPPDPAAVGECIATHIEDLLALLEESLGGAAEELAADIQVALTDPTTLPTFVGTLPARVQSVPDLAAELGEELPAAIEGIAGCLPVPTSPPAEEEPPAPEPAAQPAQHAVHYANCDDARAKGAAPVHAGQPGYGAHLDSDDDGVGCEQDAVAVTHSPKPQAQLAYTGFDVGPFAGAGAAMLAAGGLLVAGARRRS
ncbi:excalibur calcium-binding domain-containing protein [Blastococcus saxobsidens]|uniref:excalibur calcium-binding domain-containing protein n=1 Tax=Blastococcus saxobsidens TaxID=138336 RepID=UPI001B80B6AC|nr:excalibur calcium-binding domain-containing protein [Blastococcus saxobsidens]